MESDVSCCEEGRRAEIRRTAVWEGDIEDNEGNDGFRPVHTNEHIGRREEDNRTSLRYSIRDTSMLCYRRSGAPFKHLLACSNKQLVERRKRSGVNNMSKRKFRFLLSQPKPCHFLRAPHTYFVEGLGEMVLSGNFLKRSPR